jgi:hypothetical protein
MGSGYHTEQWRTRADMKNGGKYCQVGVPSMVTGGDEVGTFEAAQCIDEKCPISIIQCFDLFCI